MKINEIIKWPIKALLIAMSTIITANWSAEALKCIIFENKFCWSQEYNGWITTIGACAAFVVSFLLLFNLRQSFFPLKSFYEEKVRPKKCLIIPLSSPFMRRKDVEVKKSNGIYTVSISGKIIPDKTLNEDIKNLEGTFWSWQQMLRGIEPHQNEIKQVYLLGSPDDSEIRGSHAVLCVAESLIKHYVKNIVKIHKHGEPIVFEDFNKLSAALEIAINTLENEGYHESDIIIDITGGQKTTSIAGAAVTLDKKVTFQYVQTNPDEKGEYKVLAYDVVVQSPPTV